VALLRVRFTGLQRRGRRLHLTAVVSRPTLYAGPPLREPLLMYRRRSSPDRRSRPERRSPSGRSRECLTLYGAIFSRTFGTPPSTFGTRRRKTAPERSDVASPETRAGGDDVRDAARARPQHRGESGAHNRSESIAVPRPAHLLWHGSILVRSGRGGEAYAAGSRAITTAPPRRQRWARQFVTAWPLAGARTPRLTDRRPPMLSSN